jgi:hypothetical protein
MKSTTVFGSICLLAAVMGTGAVTAADKPGSKPADMTKPVKVFILMGQSNMVGMGNVAKLEEAVKQKKKYPYLVDEAGAWVERKDVRFVRTGSNGKGNLMNNEWLCVKPGKMGVEYAVGHALGDLLDDPVMILKSCIGNRSLAWDLLPPGSERFVEDGKVYAGYKDRPDSWVADPAKGTATEPPPWLGRDGKPVQWWAGLQYDADVADAKKALAELDKTYPGATKFEVAGFFFWQGEKDAGNAVHAAHYEKNLTNFIKALRKDFNAPDAKFVIGTMGEATKERTDNTGKVLAAHLAVSDPAKHPEFKGTVATVYTNPMAQGGSGNGHYNGNAEVYMDVGEAMGKAMVDLLKK